MIIRGLDDDLNYLSVKKNPEWVKFQKYCEKNDTYWVKDIKQADEWVLEMYKDKKWNPKMRRYLEYRREMWSAKNKCGKMIRKVTKA